MEKKTCEWHVNIERKQEMKQKKNIILKIDMINWDTLR